MSCFGNSRNVGICSELPETLFVDISGKRIPVSPIFVWFIVSSKWKTMNIFVLKVHCKNYFLLLKQINTCKITKI